MTARLALIVTALTVCVASKRVAAYHPINVKPGQWEVTETTSSNTSFSWPQSREPITKIFRSCLKEINEPWEIVISRQFIDNAKPVSPNVGKGCTPTLLESSSSRQNISFECQPKMSTSIRIKALNPERVKGSEFMTWAVVANDSITSRTVMIGSSFSAKWLGPDCVDPAPQKPGTHN